MLYSYVQSATHSMNNCLMFPLRNNHRNKNKGGSVLRLHSWGMETGELRVVGHVCRCSRVRTPWRETGFWIWIVAIVYLTENDTKREDISLLSSSLQQQRVSQQFRRCPQLTYAEQITLNAIRVQAGVLSTLIYLLYQIRPQCINRRYSQSLTNNWTLHRPYLLHCQTFDCRV